MEYVQVEGIGEVRIDIEIKPDNTSVRGNAMASGDDKYDKQVEDEILDRLNDGDYWAWASVTVRATALSVGDDVEGFDYLGACSYKDEKDFCQEGGYYEDMKEEAIADLKLQLVALKESLNRITLEEGS